MKEELTPDQSDALALFTSWLEKCNPGIPFLLSGYAGSGKTFLSMRFLKLVEKKNICWTVAAPTHKAVGVLNQSLTKERLKPTWYPSTIHRLLRLKIKRKQDLEVCEETDQTKKSLEQLGLVLIDESSMIDSILLNIILQCAFSYKTRLVFVGDTAQLPPIGEKLSSVFSMKQVVRFELSQVVRHQGPVLKLASCIRDGSIPCVSPPYIKEIKSDIGSVGCLSSADWLRKAKDALKMAAIDSSPDSARILCYTNRSIEKLVPHARRAIHGEMADQLPVLPGEVLISRTAVMAPASNDGVTVGIEQDMLLGSNRELVVSDVIPERCNLADFGIEDNWDGEVPIIDTLVAKVKADDLVLSLRLLPPVGNYHRKILDYTLSQLRAKALANSKKDARQIWRTFFLVRDAFASLGPASVLSVHRSQGSTFGEVFITSDVFWPKNYFFRKQLVYVAVSRASKGVWLLSEGEGSKTSLWKENLI